MLLLHLMHFIELAFGNEIEWISNYQKTHLGLKKILTYLGNYERKMKE